MISQHQISAGISSTSYSKDEMIISLQTKLKLKDDDLSSKNKQITTLEESIASLEEKIVDMSLELASSKSREDEYLNRLSKQQENDTLRSQQLSITTSTSRRCHPPKRGVSRSWSEGILQVTASTGTTSSAAAASSSSAGINVTNSTTNKTQPQVVDHTQSQQRPINRTSSSSRRRDKNNNTLMSSFNLGHILGLDKLKKNNEDETNDNTSKHNEDTQTEGTVSLGSSLKSLQSSNTITISTSSFVERVRRASLEMLGVEWPGEGT